MPRLRTPALAVALCLVLSAAVRSAAGPVDTNVAVPISVITAKDLQELPSCGRTVLDLVNVPPAPMLDVSKGNVTVPSALNTPDLLDHLQIRAGDGSVYPASEPFCVDRVEVLKKPLEFLYGNSVAGVVNVVTTRSSMPLSGTSAPYQSNFFSEPVLNPSQVQIIRGPFDGKGPATSVDVGGRPGLILAETQNALFWRLPADVPHGSITITVTDAGRGAKFLVYIVGLVMTADHLELLKGQSTRMQAVVFGPELIPSAGWRAGDVSATVDLTHVAQQFPGFKIPRPGEPGVVFFRLDNASQQTVSMKPSKNESFVVNLGQSNFSSGPYTYTGTIQSKRAGGFVINGTVVAFFAPIQGEPLPVWATSPTP